MKKLKKNHSSKEKKSPPTRREDKNIKSDDKPKETIGKQIYEYLMKSL